MRRRSDQAQGAAVGFFFRRLFPGEIDRRRKTLRVELGGIELELSRGGFESFSEAGGLPGDVQTGGFSGKYAVGVDTLEIGVRAAQQRARVLPGIPC